MSLIVKDTYRLGLDHSVAKSAAFIVNQKNEPFECLYATMITRSVKKTKVYEIRIQHFKYLKNSEQDESLEKLRYRAMVISDKVYPLSESVINSSKRNHIISEAIVNFIKDFEMRFTTFTEVKLEGYSYGSVGSLLDIAESTGILKNKLFQIGYEKIELIPPTKLKTWITDYGHANKELVAIKMISKMGIDFGNDDINDAYLLCICPKFESIKKVKKVKKKGVVVTSPTQIKGYVSILETSNLTKKKAS